MGKAAAFAQDQEILQLNVLADHTLVRPMSKIARIYTTQYHIAVALDFGTTEILARQVSEGYPADVMVAAHPYWITQLKNQGLLDVHSIAPIAWDRLVLAVHLSNRWSPKPESDWAAEMRANHPGSVFLASDPMETSRGRYLDETLQALGQKERLSPMLLATEPESVISSLAENPLAVSVAYYGEVFGNPNLRVATYLSDLPGVPMAVYTSAVVAGEHMKEAREFIQFLHSEQARQVWKEFGLRDQPPKSEASAP